MTETNEVAVENYSPEFEILYEDNHIIVVLKKQMTACCPDESKDDNLFDQIKKYLKTALQSADTPYRLWKIRNLVQIIPVLLE